MSPAASVIRNSLPDDPRDGVEYATPRAWLRVWGDGAVTYDGPAPGKPDWMRQRGLEWYDGNPDLARLVRAVIDHGEPPEPLLDYLSEHAPEPVRHFIAEHFAGPQDPA